MTMGLLKMYYKTNSLGIVFKAVYGLLICMVLCICLNSTVQAEKGPILAIPFQDPNTILVIYGKDIVGAKSVVKDLKRKGVKSAFALKGREDGSVRIFANGGLWLAYYSQASVDSGELVNKILDRIAHHQSFSSETPCTRKEAYQASTGRIIIHYGAGREVQSINAAQKIKKEFGLDVIPVKGASSGLVSIFVNRSAPVEISIEGVIDPSKPRNTNQVLVPKSEDVIGELVYLYAIERFNDRLSRQWSEVRELFDEHLEVLEARLKELDKHNACLEEELSKINERLEEIYVLEDAFNRLDELFESGKLDVNNSEHQELMRTCGVTKKNFGWRLIINQKRDSLRAEQAELRKRLGAKGIE